MEPGNVGLNMLQRRFGMFMLAQKVPVEVFESNAGLALTSVTIKVDFLAKVRGLGRQPLYALATP
jgi:hypothetical protein